MVKYKTLKQFFESLYDYSDKSTALHTFIIKQDQHINCYVHELYTNMSILLFLLFMILSEAIALIVKTKHSITYLASNIALRRALLVNLDFTLLCLPMAPNTCLIIFLKLG